MNSNQFKRWLARQGCIFEPAKGGHLLVRCGRHRSYIPMHGSRKQLRKGLVTKIKKDLGLM
ncbi:MAG: type II toxin-antitoxin system HicA family toxin [Alphaproteobacteria bacterium]